MMETKNKIDEWLEEGGPEMTLRRLEELEPERLDESLLLQWGELLYGAGKMTEALNKFNAVLRKNPANLKAGNYVDMINRILGYYCKELFNP